MQIANDLGKDPRNGRELTGPVRPLMGPGDPSRLMRLPFRGHVIAESSRQGSHDQRRAARIGKALLSARWARSSLGDWATGHPAKALNWRKAKRAGKCGISHRATPLRPPDELA